MTSIVVGLDDALAGRLADEARRVGLTPEQLAQRALEAFLGERSAAGDADPFAFIGMMRSSELLARDVDDLLAKGFGRSRSS